MPIRTVRTMAVDRPLDTVAAYLSDFTTSARWDPHTVSCRRLDDGPLGVGARFENVQKLLGRRSTLTYEVVNYAPGSRIVLRGGNDTITTQDEMTFERRGDGSAEVTYQVEASLHGAAKLAQPVFALVLQKIADEAARQLPRTVQAELTAA